MKPKRTFRVVSARHARTWLVAALFIAGEFAVRAQDTNTVSQTDLSSFRVIGQRNIFDPSRTSRRRERSREAPKVADTFSLVGTMSSIAGYSVTGITPTAVKLDASGRQLEMKVGSYMERDDAGTWKLVANSEMPAPSTTSPVESADESSSSPPSSGEANDVLKRLMQQREQELK
jgi:hypothetical protein